MTPFSFSISFISSYIFGDTVMSWKSKWIMKSSNEIKKSNSVIFKPCRVAFVAVYTKFTSQSRGEVNHHWEFWKFDTSSVTTSLPHIKVVKNDRNLAPTSPLSLSTRPNAWATLNLPTLLNIITWDTSQEQSITFFRPSPSSNVVNCQCFCAICQLTLI